MGERNEQGLETVLLTNGALGKNYSVRPLESFDANRHISLDSAYELIRMQEDPKGLPESKLANAVEEGTIRVYEHGGEKHLDRLDIGRVYHQKPRQKTGMTFQRYFSEEGKDPLQSMGPYTPRDLQIRDFKTGKTVWEMKGAEFPSNWDGDGVGQQIVAQKYFFKPEKKEWREKIIAVTGREEEFSIAHLTRRVTDFFTDKGDEYGYFATEEDREIFRDELAALQIERKAAFNSPVQFNAGIHNTYGIEGSKARHFHRDPETGEVKRVTEGEFVYPQCHACFIKGPRDDLESIATHVADEMSIFSAGSGIGQAIGVLREEGAKLSGGGKSSGPMSFLAVYDKGAGTVKSGGKSRRAARMTTMMDHRPDIMEFVRSKVREDKKALTLMEAGYEGGMDGEACTTVGMQNTNISVRARDTLFEAAEKGHDIDLYSVTTGEKVKSISADRLLKEMAFGTWRVGDPGVQYDDTIARMHTAPHSGRQQSTNPCGEYMFLDDTSCNLASLNLLQFADEKGRFDPEAFRRAVRIISTAQDIANDAASMPVEDIAQISPEFRTIGIGYANLGALLMRRGLAYDSDEGRNLAAAITATMTGESYATSAELAGALEPFVHYELNQAPMAEVMKRHRRALEDVVWDNVEPELKEAAHKAWDKAIEKGEQHGYRNAQASVLAPTGTISFLMGCDTTGVEPAPSLMITKNLAGGGNVTIANREIPRALENLGYGEAEIRDILEYIEKPVVENGPPRGAVRGAPHLSPDHYEVFDTAFGGSSGEDSSIGFGGHVGMVAAVQPFISGGISKTMNFPEQTTVKEIYDAITLGHKLGLKGLTAFRNNSKPTVAMGFGDQSFVKPKRGEKVDLPAQRIAYETEVTIGGTPLHVQVSEYENGLPGQLTFLSYKAGSDIGALLTTAGITASRSLKRGVRLEDVAEGWIGHEFSPNGLVNGHPHIKTAVSPLDFAGKLLRLEYLGDTSMANDPESVDQSNLRGAKNGAFYTLARQGVDEWDIDAVLKDPILGGFENGKKLEELQQKIPQLRPVSSNGQRGKPCNSCGKIMKQTAPGCFSCDNCGDKVGGCGL